MTAHPSAEPPPSAIRISRGRDRLTVVWPDGRELTFDAALLRRHCQSAKAKRQRLTAPDIPSSAGVVIAEVRPVGGYAINIAFSDGHDRGIYPWRFLAELAEGNKLTDSATGQG